MRACTLSPCFGQPVHALNAAAGMKICAQPQTQKYSKLRWRISPRPGSRILKRLEPMLSRLNGRTATTMESTTGVISGRYVHARSAGRMSIMIKSKNWGVCIRITPVFSHSGQKSINNRAGCVPPRRRQLQPGCSRRAWTGCC